MDLFSKLFTSAQVRGGDIAEVFKHETRPEPPSLSNNGELRSSLKADLLKLFQPKSAPETSEPDVDATIIEGSVLVNILKLGNASTFKDYAEDVFLKTIKSVFFQNIKSESKKVDRIDIVFDTYMETSLKSTSREIRGKGIRRKVESDSKPPKDWMSFLRLNQNKTELFRYRKSS